MAVLFTRALTLYTIVPHDFLVVDLSDTTLRTAGTQTKQLCYLPKGSVVVNCWVDVTTAQGSSDGGSSLNMDTKAGGSAIFLLTVNANATGITRGPITATGYDPLTDDGFLQFTKAGLGTALVLSIFVRLLRPNMNP